MNYSLIFSFFPFDLCTDVGDICEKSYAKLQKNLVKPKNNYCLNTPFKFISTTVISNYRRKDWKNAPLCIVLLAKLCQYLGVS